MRVIKGHLGTNAVLISVKDALYLWEHGFYGVFPKNDTRRALLYGTIALHEAYYLLVQSEKGKGDFGFTLEKDSIPQDSTTVLIEVQKCETAYLRTIVYKKLRELGWIIQSGLNYGVDFLLYQISPEEEHAPYAVVVRTKQRDMTWQEAISLNRVAATARKKLVVAYVYQDEVKFLQISRWNLDSTSGQSVKTPNNMDTIFGDGDRNNNNDDDKVSSFMLYLPNYPSYKKRNQ